MDAHFRIVRTPHRPASFVANIVSVSFSFSFYLLQSSILIETSVCQNCEAFRFGFAEGVLSSRSVIHRIYSLGIRVHCTCFILFKMKCCMEKCWQIKINSSAGSHFRRPSEFARYPRLARPCISVVFDHCHSSRIILNGIFGLRENEIAGQ